MPVPTTMATSMVAAEPTVTRASMMGLAVSQTSEAKAYRTEFSMIEGRLWKLLVEEVTVTEVETVLVKRSIATSAPVGGHGHVHGLPRHSHFQHDG